MKQVLILAVALFLLSFSLTSCAGNKQDTNAETSNASLALCGGCGEIKGSDQCCKAGHETCTGCKLHKASPGCCKIEKGAGDVALCACGEIKGSENCCKHDAEKCTGCEKIKGSPGCCK